MCSCFCPIQMFDPSLKKKKKKKKTPFDLDAAMGEDGTVEDKAEEATEKAEEKPECQYNYKEFICSYSRCALFSYSNIFGGP